MVMCGNVCCLGIVLERRCGLGGVLFVFVEY